MAEPTAFNPKEPDEIAAPVVILYLGGIVTTLLTVLTLVFWVRGNP